MSRYPVLLGEPHNGQWKVWCPFCQHWHYHGIGEGHREAHCFGNEASPFHETGYWIRLRLVEEEKLEVDP